MRLLGGCTDLDGVRVGRSPRGGWGREAIGLGADACGRTAEVHRGLALGDETVPERGPADGRGAGGGPGRLTTVCPPLRPPLRVRGRRGGHPVWGFPELESAKKSGQYRPWATHSSFSALSARPRLFIPNIPSALFYRHLRLLSVPFFAAAIGLPIDFRHALTSLQPPSATDKTPKTARQVRKTVALRNENSRRFEFAALHYLKSPTTVVGREPTEKSRITPS